MTKTNSEPVSDAAVDTYRALRDMNAKPAVHVTAATVITRGAGVDPKRVIRAGKRLRNWHRANRWDLNGRATQSLRSYARTLASSDLSGNMTAAAWLDRKAA